MSKRFVVKRFLITTALLSLSFAPAYAQGRGNQPAPTIAPQGESAQSREEHFGPAEEKTSTTAHTVRLDGREIKYTATTGTFPFGSTTARWPRACSSSRTPRTARR